MSDRFYLPYVYEPIITPIFYEKNPKYGENAIRLAEWILKESVLSHHLPNYIECWRSKVNNSALGYGFRDKRAYAIEDFCVRWSENEKGEVYLHFEAIIVRTLGELIGDDLESGQYYYENYIKNRPPPKS